MLRLPFFRDVKAKLATSDDAAAQLVKVEELLAKTRADIAAMEAGRDELLLNGDDAALDGQDAKILEARRLVERLAARSEALQEELATIGAREAAEALTARHATASTQADASERWLREVYPSLARQLVEGLENLKAAEAEIDRVNDAVATLDAPLERIRKVEARDVHDRLSDGPLRFNVSLKPMPAIGAPGYGPELGVSWIFG